MGLKFIVVFSLVAVSISSCTQNKSMQMKEDAQKIAGMECISRGFTREKFLLASQYTKLDDQLLNKQISKQANDSMRTMLDVKKASLVKQSQVVSDSLLHFLRAAWKERYADKKAKMELDSLTELELKRTCKTSSP